MCGIIGVVGSDDTLATLLEGLTRLEYRGYDSAGIALVRAGETWRARTASGTESVTALKEECRAAPKGFTVGHRPHPLGDARRARSDQRAPAPGLLGQHRDHPQRHHRESHGVTSGPRVARTPLHVGHRLRGAGAPDRGVPRAGVGVDGSRSPGTTRRARRLRPRRHGRDRTERHRRGASHLAARRGHRAR